MPNDKIAYQNKDIVSKTLAENLKGKAFRAYGLNLPQVTQVMPTNLPTVKANELRIDNLFKLEDNTVAIVDYESAYRNTDKIKYLNYLTGIANRYLRDKIPCPMLRMIVIYTGDIRRRQVSTEYNVGAVKIRIEPAFLSELDPEDIFDTIAYKIKNGECLSDEELMQFIILPLTYRQKKYKEKAIQNAVELAARVQDRNQQLFVLAGILAFTDKIIDNDTANKIRRMIQMTKVAMIFEEEKQLAIKQAVEQTIQLEREKNDAAIELLLTEKDSKLAEKEQELMKLRTRIAELESQIN